MKRILLLFLALVLASYNCSVLVAVGEGQINANDDIISLPIINSVITDDDGLVLPQWSLTQIEAGEAWDKTFIGSHAVKVGILDTGLNAHSDLTTNINWNLA